MFTWICPKCGREVGPSYSECPFCAEAASKPAAAPPPPQQPQYAPPPYPQAPYPPQGYPQQQYPPQQYPPHQQSVPPPHYQPQPVPPQYVPVPPPAPAFEAPKPDPIAPPPLPPSKQVYYVGADDNKAGIPQWLAFLLAFAAIGLVVWGIISIVRHNRNPAAKSAVVAKKGDGESPYKRYLELGGFRISESAKKMKVEFIAVNHGAADMANVGGTVKLLAKGAEADTPACTFKFQISNLPAYGVKEIIVTDFSQKRKFIDMPDWQFLVPVVELNPSE